MQLFDVIKNDDMTNINLFSNCFSDKYDKYLQHGLHLHAVKHLHQPATDCSLRVTNKAVKTGLKELTASFSDANIIV